MPGTQDVLSAFWGVGQGSDWIADNHTLSHVSWRLKYFVKLTYKNACKCVKAPGGCARLAQDSKEGTGVISVQMGTVVQKEM